MIDILQQLQTVLQDPRLDDVDRQEWLPLVGQLSPDEQKELIAVFTEEITDRDALGEAITAAVAGVAAEGIDFSEVRPEDLEKKSVEELERPEFLPKLVALQEYFEERSEVLDGPPALVAALDHVVHHEDFKKRDQRLWRQFQDLWIRSRWHVAAHVKERDVLELVRTTFLAAVRGGLPVLDRLNVRFVFFADSLRGDEDRKRFLQAIREDEESIGKEPLLYEKESERPPPSVKYWLLDYDRFAPPTKSRDEFSRVTYMNQSQNVRSLSKEDRDLLLKVLETFDSLAYPKPEVVETERRGVASSARAPARSEDVKRTMMTVAPDRAQLEAYATRVTAEFTKNRQDAATTLTQIVSTSTVPVATDTAYGLLYLLAREGTLTSIVSTQSALADRLRSYGKDERLPKLIQALDVGGSAPVVVAALLRYTLERRASVAREQAAAFGALIGRILKERSQPQYGAIAYYDLKKKQFTWAE